MKEAFVIDGKRDGDAAFWAAFEEARARVLRRRMVVCVLILLGLLVFGIFGTYLEYREVMDGKGTPLEWVVLGVLEDVALAALLFATLMYVLNGRPDRRRLVGAITISTVVLLGVAIAFETLRGQVHPTDFWGDALRVPIDAGLLAARWALIVVGLIVTLPLVLLPMRWGESARIAGACWVVYVALVVGVGKAGVGVAVGYSGLAALAMAPGMVFSAWRYSRFDAKFRHEDLQGRFGELSKELEQARKLHEALFPVVVEDGPERVRVKFVYEPMREIGGDFVFVHRGKEEQSAGGGKSEGEMGRGVGVFVVLIDVSGHGVAAALAVNRMHGELVRMFGARGGGEMCAGIVIENLNAYVYLTLAPQGVYATAVCVRVSGGGEGSGGGEWELEWANAGHPPALLRSGAAAGGEVHRLEPTTTMLGVIEPEVFEGHARRMGMGPGDVVVAYTDGLTEARGETGEEYGAARVEAVVRGVGIGAADALARGVGAHRAGRVKDDLLVVEVGVVGAAVVQAQ